MKTTQLSYMAPGLWTVEEMTVKYLSESPYVNFVNIDEHSINNDVIVKYINMCTFVNVEYYGDIHFYTFYFRDGEKIKRAFELSSNDIDVIIGGCEHIHYMYIDIYNNTQCCVKYDIIDDNIIDCFDLPIEPTTQSFKNENTDIIFESVRNKHVELNVYSVTITGEYIICVRQCGSPSIIKIGDISDGDEHLTMRATHKIVT